MKTRKLSGKNPGHDYARGYCGGLEGGLEESPTTKFNPSKQTAQTEQKIGGGGWFEEKGVTLYNPKSVIWENLLKGRVGWGWMREFGEGMCT